MDDVALVFFEVFVGGGGLAAHFEDGPVEIAFVFQAHVLVGAECSAGFE